jgi:hypothetical protein
MGGLGSGCWERDDDDKKTAVAECYTIDVNELAKDGKLRVGAAGVTQWEDQDGEDRFSVAFSTVCLYGGERILELSYRWDDPWDEEDSEDILLQVRLQKTRPHLGGVRWWFTCPLVVNGNPCNRRVAKLYLPDDARYFGCRHCHGLVYRREPDPLEHADRMATVLEKRMERAKKKHGWET